MVLAMTVIGGIVWFVSGLLRKKPSVAESDLPEKSIVDSPIVDSPQSKIDVTECTC